MSITAVTTRHKYTETAMIGRKYLVKLNTSEAARGVHKNGVLSTEGFSMSDRSRFAGVHTRAGVHVSRAFSNVAWISDDRYRTGCDSPRRTSTDIGVGGDTVLNAENTLVNFHS